MSTSSWPKKPPPEQELIELQVRPSPAGRELRVAGAGTLDHGETRVFQLELHGRTREAFVLGYEGELLAYLNECPHWAVELDLGDGHFFDEEIERIYCKNHGALFEPRSGACGTGPCLGRSLDRFSARRDGDDAVVLVPDPDARLVEA